MPPRQPTAPMRRTIAILNALLPRCDYREKFSVQIEMKRAVHTAHSTQSSLACSNTVCVAFSACPVGSRICGGCGGR